MFQLSKCATVIPVDIPRTKRGYVRRLWGYFIAPSYELCRTNSRSEKTRANQKPAKRRGTISRPVAFHVWNQYRPANFRSIEIVNCRCPQRKWKHKGTLLDQRTETGQATRSRYQRKHAGYIERISACIPIDCKEPKAFPFFRDQNQRFPQSNQARPSLEDYQLPLSGGRVERELQYTQHA